MDVRTYRGANIDSDHYLVLSRIRSRISNAKKDKGIIIKKFDCDKFQDPNTASEYTNKVNERLGQPEINEQLTVEDKWIYLSTKVKDSAEQTLGMVDNKTITKDRYDGECRIVTEGKNKLQAYNRMHSNKFTRISLENYREARKMKKKYIEEKKENMQIVRWRSQST